MHKTRLAQRLGLAGVVVLLAAVAAAPAAAEERTCRGTLGAVTVDNLRVSGQRRLVPVRGFEPRSRG